MPPMSAFENVSSYYPTVFHELGHLIPSLDDHDR